MAQGTQLSVQDDPNQLETLYHASYRRLVAQVFAFTTDLSEAQDAVQEAFARALARRQQLADVDAPEAWLRTVAVNIVRRRWRRKQLFNTIMLRERPLAKLIADAPEPDRTDLREALATLPRTYREVIVLHYLADLPVDEVASILEVPVGTVKSRLSRGREALKGLLDDVEAPPLQQVRQRAGKIRTRRQATQAGAALAFVCAVAIGFFPWINATPEVPMDQPPAPPVNASAGIKVIGIADVPGIPDLPGDIDRMEFHNGTGWLRTSTGAYARSADGGQSWEMVAQPDATVFSPSWRPAAPVWQDFWAAPRPTSTGVWWMAGRTADGKRQFAHTTDPSLTGSWNWFTVPDAPAGRSFAATTWGGKVIFFTDAVYTVDTSGVPQRISDLSPTVLNGHPIMLPDGRMLAAGAGTQWQVSTDLGAHWTDLAGLPAVRSLHPTGSGYVALGLFNSYTATSPDGVTWQKLPIR